MNKNSMLYWWPLVKDLPMPKPKTTLVEHDWRVWVGLLDGKPLPAALQTMLQREAGAIGYPLFMLTDLASAKHDYESTCFVAGPSALLPNLGCLIDATMARDLLPSAIVLREYIPLVSSFTAFRGLPIARERRYFVSEGHLSASQAGVLCHHPYWPADAVKRGRPSPSSEGWRKALAALNAESPPEIELLTSYAALVAHVAQGDWSVDFAHGQDDQWYLIDMALAADSWHPDCPVKENEEAADV